MSNRQEQDFVSKTNKLDQITPCPLVRPKTIKLLEEIIGQKLHNIGFVNDFLDMTSKAQVRKKNKLEIIKIKYFCTSKDTINREKATNGSEENICTSYLIKD